MQIRVRRASFRALLPTCLGLLVACQSGEPAEPAVIAGPLPLDPTQTETIGQWWSDGNRLLRLDPDGAYTLYDQVNPYTPPTQRGRWSQGSYAVLWLQPYDTLDTERIRVSIARIDEGVALTVPDLPPMLPLSAPPPVLEDELIGAWIGAGGALMLEPNLDYALAPATAGVSTDVIVVGHNGRWSVEDKRLTLRPRSPGMRAVHFEIEQTEDELVLRSEGMSMRKDQ